MGVAVTKNYSEVKAWEELCDLAMNAGLAQMQRFHCDSVGVSWENRGRQGLIGSEAWTSE